MKTVSGTVISSKPISISKASKILSHFVSADNGASHAVSAYLKRASESFNELAALHRELRSQRPTNKRNKKAKENLSERNPRENEHGSEEHGDGRDLEGSAKEKRKMEIMGVPGFGRVDGRSSGAMEENLSDEKKKKKKKKKEVEAGVHYEEVGQRIDDEKGRNERKKKKKSSGEIQSVDGISLGMGMKSNGELQNGEVERIDGGSLGAEVENGRKERRKKKKKSGEIQDGGVEERVDGTTMEVEEEKGRKEREHMKITTGVQNGEALTPEEEKIRKERKKRKGTDEIRYAGSLGGEEKIKEERKKRKSGEIQEEDVDNSAKRHTKKKRRRIENDDKM